MFVEGVQNRMVTAHEMNSESSRSHAILTLKLQKKVLLLLHFLLFTSQCSSDFFQSYDKAANTVWVTNGKISFVDLAGSESVKLTKTTGVGLQETAGINKSLLALSNVVSKLSDAATNPSTSAEVLGWRNSKLTQLLMDSLVGAGFTISECQSLFS